MESKSESEGSAFDQEILEGLEQRRLKVRENILHELTET